MDKLTKAVLDHESMNETMAVFKKHMSIVDSEKTPNYVKNLSNFFQEYIIAHFDFEEKDIFPTVLAVGELKRKHLIRLMQEEHILILDRVDEFKDLVLKYGFHPDEKQMEELVNLSREIIEMVFSHTRKEDKELYPFLKDIDFNFNA